MLTLSRVHSKTVLTEQALAVLNIGPTAPATRLAVIELGGSLAWSLIASAFEEGSISAAIPLTRMRVVREDFRQKGLRLDRLDQENEVSSGQPRQSLFAS